MYIMISVQALSAGVSEDHSTTDNSTQSFSGTATEASFGRVAVLAGHNRNWIIPSTVLAGEGMDWSQSFNEIDSLQQKSETVFLLVLAGASGYCLLTQASKSRAFLTAFNQFGGGLRNWQSLIPCLPGPKGAVGLGLAGRRGLSLLGLDAEGRLRGRPWSGRQRR
jgi:hypothetical protein